MSETERHKVRITDACKKWGLDIKGWDEEGLDGLEADLGRASLIDDNEVAFAGDEGKLTAGVVGAPEYGNERVAFYFTPDGMDFGGDEIAPDDVDLI